MTLVLKDPASSLDYMVDWRLGYLTSDDSLLESSWSVVPVEAGGLRVDSTRFDGDAAIVNVSGGQPGKLYRLLNQVATSLGREDSRSIFVRVEPR